MTEAKLRLLLAQRERQIERQQRQIDDMAETIQALRHRLETACILVDRYRIWWLAERGAIQARIVKKK